ncbi:MAG: hypothetical protein M3Q68_04040, partial [Actinomycetota bacterium]|nr:hypothetical protein [Actinomycetota bacterium]
IYEEPVNDTVEVPYDVPVAAGYEPVGEPILEPVYQPVSEPAPVVAFTAPAPDPAADAGSGFATVGGPSPYGGMTIVEPGGTAVDPGAFVGGASTIGGADPYGGITIVDTAGQPVDRSVVSPNEFVLGSSSPVVGNGFTMVPDPNAPVYDNPMPRVPIVPSANDSINDILVRHVSTMAALNSLSRAENPNP